MKQIFKYLILFTLLLSCADNKRVQQYEYNDNVGTIEELSYVKDKSTNLCFAVWGLRSYFAVMSNVPCSEEVLKKIINK